MNTLTVEREFELTDAEFKRLRDLVHLRTGIALSDAKREMLQVFLGHFHRRHIGQIEDAQAVGVTVQGEAHLGTGGEARLRAAGRWVAKRPELSAGVSRAPF